MLHTVTAEIRHIAVNIRQGNGPDQSQVNIHNIDLIKGHLAQRRIAQTLDIAKEIPQIQKVFIHSAPRVRLDGLVIAEEICQNTR